MSGSLAYAGLRQEDKRKALGATNDGEERISWLWILPAVQAGEGGQSQNVRFVKARAWGRTAFTSSPLRVSVPVLSTHTLDAVVLASSLAGNKTLIFPMNVCTVSLTENCRIMQCLFRTRFTVYMKSTGRSSLWASYGLEFDSTQLPQLSSRRTRSFNSGRKIACRVDTTNSNPERQTPLDVPVCGNGVEFGARVTA